MDGRLQVFAGNSNPALAEAIIRFLGAPLGRALVGQFKNGETRVKLDENVRGSDVFIIQSMQAPVNHHLMELLIMLDAVRRASAARITAVIPYFGYARQEKKTSGREPIAAKLVANLLVTAGAQRILTLDLHAPAIEGFFDIPVDHLRSAPLLAEYFRGRQLDNVVVVSPDAGGVGRAEDFRIRIGADLAIIAKKRRAVDHPEVIEMVGDVAGKTAIIVDDIIGTGGTLVEAAETLTERGASAIYACAVHPLFSDGAARKMTAAGIRRAIVTDTVPLNEQERDSATEVLSVAPLLAEAIMRIHKGLSISALFS
ncbi:MAG TPA: ribose-phosphate pyrophosphokinase [Thermomicrobiales bacterium]|nr:ribose-phosphate pyrophosphokinase [Thermomicrobiales bacterium]